MASSNDEAASPHVPLNKDVTFSEETEAISPMLLGSDGDSPHLSSQSKRYRTSLGSKRLSGRASIDPLSPSVITEAHSTLMESGMIQQSPKRGHSLHHRSNSGESHHSLVSQVNAWIEKEKSRRAARKRRSGHSKRTRAKEIFKKSDPSQQEASDEDSRPGSRSSDSSTTALDELEQMIKSKMMLEGKRSSISSQRRISSARKLKPESLSSDTEYSDGDAIVPTCDAILDNTKVLAYESDDNEPGADEGTERALLTRKVSEGGARATFKYEIVRLTHTLRLKGWRRVPLESSDSIKFQRLSGALTNAVYVVSPPDQVLPPRNSNNSEAAKPVPKLLLRIYGPQVEHLIDREAELQILKRLARKKIGPRLLGTFTNGRFEEYLNAVALTPGELRMPQTSIAIAKRMRELHDGIELLERERAGGPFVWQNWDKWVDRCQRIMTWLDDRVKESRDPNGRKGSVKSMKWAENGFVCGTEWGLFRQTVDKYRAMLEEQYGGEQQVKDKLVFAHNDTQYGNILRIKPPGESPLLLPANQHRQLVVIDFEYARQNLVAFEFANHFTEWCYNYHDEQAPHAITVSRYPGISEQLRFIRAYLEHKWTPPSHQKTPTMSPQNSNPGTPLSAGAGPAREVPQTPPTPRPIALGHHSADSTSSSISTLMLDHASHSRNASLNQFPNRPRPTDDDRGYERESYDNEAERLLAETRLWRMVNSAQWVAWGVVQANVPSMPKSVVEGKEIAEESNAPEEETSNDEAEPEEEDFDYLGYARDRVLFFWGDAVQLGVVKPEDLPADVREQLKIVRV